VHDAQALRPVALELHGLLRDLDPSRWRDDFEAALRRRVAEIEAAVRRILARSEAPNGLAKSLENLSRLLRERLPARELPAVELRAAWARYREELQLAYEGLRKSLSASRVEVPSIRPTNYTRSIFHALVAIVLVLLVEEVLSDRGRWLVPFCFAATFWTLELLRHISKRARSFLLWLFRAIAHPHERYRVNSSTWLATALVLLGALFAPLPCTVALAVMGIADPTAAFIGRRWGRTTITAQRSLEGSLAFLVAGTLAAAVVLAIWYPSLPLIARLGIACAASLCGALAELASRRLDDNFTVPLAAGGGAWLAFTLLAL
jgi:dolichol kinase